MRIKTLAIVVRRLRLRVTLTAAGTVITVLVAPGTSSAASPPYPVCGNPNDNPVHHCYVEADMSYPGGQPAITSLAGVFTVPKKLNVKPGAYSIAQMTLFYGYSDIELGWIVAPGLYKDQHPHLFVFFRSSGGACEEGIPNQTTPLCPMNSSAYVPLGSKYHAGMALSGKSALFYVGYDSHDNFWYIQYQDQYFAKMSWYWWYLQQKYTFAGGDTASWYGEIYTPNAKKYACTAMGNGILGSRPGSATVTDMMYGTGGPTLLPANAVLEQPTYQQYWNSSRQPDVGFTSSFSFGGPGDCK